MNFQESNDYLLSLGNEVSTMKLGLENIRKMLTALGDPQRKYVKVQVAGTNGKGSVCAFLEAITVRAGIRAGIYTSPHLISITERIKIDGGDISEGDFARLATRVRTISETLSASGDIGNVPTFFEQVTAIALLAFAEAKVELAILETGLGGRLDATTSANAEIAAITRIDLDHQQYLGETIEEIAAEKAAIIHAGSRVVIGEQKPAAMEVILERCSQLAVTPKLAIEGVSVSGREGVSVSDRSISLGLAGRHQIENAQVAIGVVEILRDHFAISDLDVIGGLGSARHPGRLERVGRFLLDGAHNPGGAHALREYLDEFVPDPITMIYGSMEDKDMIAIAGILFPRAAKLILTAPQNPRAIPPARLAGLVNVSVDGERIFVTRDIDEAVGVARAVSGEDDVIVVTGSLYLVGETLAILSFEETEN